MAKPVAKPVKAAVETDRIGFFGKIPSHGDFISEGLDRELISAIDGWLRAGMHACADVFVDRWSAVFSTFPPIRFIIERGVWGRHAYTGVLMPSRDRVGRKYPLVILAQLGDFKDHPKALYLDETWFMAAEALAETSLTADFDMARFTMSVKRLRMPKPREDDDTLPAPTSGQPTSLWWHIDPESRRPRGIKIDGRPATTDFVRLFRTSAPEENTAAAKTEPDLSSMSQGPTIVPQSAVAQEPKPRQTPALDIVYSYATHPGTRLSVNADALFVSKSPTLFAIADGIGDGNPAVEAARLTTNALTDVADSDHADSTAQDIKGKLGTVNSLLLSRQISAETARPLASVVVASIVGRTLTVLWSGDTRAYLLRDGTMHLLSRDHVIVGMKKQLSQCIGHAQQFRPSNVSEEFGTNDRLLLCSYPLMQALKERVVAEILHDTPINDCANALMQEALIENVRENISAIVIGDRLERRG
ncbi:type VI secretion system-associated protein TagF [Rhizobium skierniewicense]|uniref:type VI secretion system-associated protein TagF n=1 Tax=Rhizobium skierniewicense TaxID=984260 RepID=UPI001572631B|nr:type VI secretion system-associated protein TagF [Rhizobium skierniewicense]NTF33716.1 type VI secretion system-associated protein TagF [Rhizobium skierniewicense]